MGVGLEGVLGSGRGGLDAREGGSTWLGERSYEEREAPRIRDMKRRWRLT